MRVTVAHLYACLSKCGPCCIDAGRKEQKTRWGSRLTQSNEGWSEGDIGDSASHWDNKYKLTRSKGGGPPVGRRMLWQRPTVTAPGVSTIPIECASTSLRKGTAALNSLDMGACKGAWRAGLRGSPGARQQGRGGGGCTRLSF